MVTRHSEPPRHSSLIFSNSYISMAVAATALLVLGLFAFGCASPGEPSARKPLVPETISDLAASQSGNGALLTFTVPKDSLEGAPLEHSPTVEIYRDFEAVPAANELHPISPKRPTLLTTIPSGLVAQYTIGGQFRYLDRLDVADFTAHPSSIILYSVRTRISAKKTSSPSNIAALRVYPAPEPISDVQGKVTPTAVALAWTAPQRTPVGPIPPPAGYRIYRGEAQSSPPAANEGSSSSPSGSLPGAVPSRPALQTPLMKIGESTFPSFSDTHAEFGKTYVYSVRSVIDYSGFAVESANSNFLTITARDIFPPAAPTGLIGIFVPAAPGAAAHVDLSWAVSSETDLAGYHVYRSERAGILGTLMDTELLPTPAFRDMNVAPGQRYFYAVTAVDRSGNESQPSTAMSVNVPAATQTQP